MDASVVFSRSYSQLATFNLHDLFGHSLNLLEYGGEGETKMKPETFTPPSWRAPAPTQRAPQRGSPKGPAPPSSAPDFLLRPRGAVKPSTATLWTPPPPFPFLASEPKNGKPTTLSRREGTENASWFFSWGRLAPGAPVYLQLEPRARPPRTCPASLLTTRHKLAKGNVPRATNWAPKWWFWGHAGVEPEQKPAPEGPGRGGFVCAKGVRKSSPSKRRDDRVMGPPQNQGGRSPSRKSGGRENSKQAKRGPPQKDRG
ncbi:hypothetical protein GWK47_025559 [Chionoecetes opilio]|uniref:Uncharacterized protein n=1 Tax=Chionoecetes opilio TaxID=41210 RepID=A0A8J8WF63_CHIOP|nr:hypothetical protein GWK47_025559 [Chionoecetes opilio]